MENAFVSKVGGQSPANSPRRPIEASVRQHGKSAVDVDAYDDDDDDENNDNNGCEY